MGGRTGYAEAQERAWLLERIAQEPDLTLRALMVELKERGLVVSYYALWHFLQHEDITFKKSLHASQQDLTISPGVSVGASTCSTWDRKSDLPPYPPDLNPIGQVFAKLKTLLRKAGGRIVEDTWKRIGTLLDAFSPQECANYIRNARYASA